MQPACPEKQELSDQVAKAREAYAKATKELKSIDYTEFETAYLKAQVVRVAYERALGLLEAHTKEHGCAELDQSLRIRVANPLSQR